MGNLFKYVLWSSPVLALIIYLVFTGQQKIDVEMVKQDLLHERDKAEMNVSFATTTAEKRKYRERAEAASQELAMIEKKEQGLSWEKDKVKKEFDQDLEEYQRERPPRPVETATSWILKLIVVAMLGAAGYLGWRRWQKNREKEAVDAHRTTQ